jgi:hypothetical protein
MNWPSIAWIIDGSTEYRQATRGSEPGAEVANRPLITLKILELADRTEAFGVSVGGHDSRV